MLVACPKCKTRLKIADEKIAPGGSRFKCPKCATVLLVKRPAKPAVSAVSVRPLDSKKAIVAHASPDIVERAKSVLLRAGYSVITATDGVDMMVKTQKELPGIAMIDVALPKIYGFEVCKRLRERPETKGMRLILISSVHDKTRYRREPVSLYGADDYIDEHEMEEKLIAKVKGEAAPEAPKPLETAYKPATPPRTPLPEIKPEPAKPAVSPQMQRPEAAPQPSPKPEPKPELSKPVPPPTGLVSPPTAAVKPEPIKPEIKPALAPKPEAAAADVPVEKARRLIRAILSDIYLYSAQKVEESIRAGKFREAFASELREGLKLYDQRVTAETKKKGDFFNEEIEKFLVTRKKSLGLA